MDTLTGVLLDVSGSMKSSIGDTSRPNTRGGSWARSIFEVVDGLIKHDVSSSNHVFALGFGASREPQAFDLLNTIEANIENIKKANRYYNSLSKKEVLEKILSFLEINGAPRVRKWAKMNVLCDVIEESDACSFLKELRNNEDFKEQFIDTCLPKECKELEFSTQSFIRETSYFGFGLIDRVFGMERGGGCQEYATKASVIEVVNKGKELLKLLKKYILARIGPGAVMNVHKASGILHEGMDEDEDELTDQRLDELMETVEPLIYGGTPLMKTIKEALYLFARTEFKNYKKLMFILSDGMSSDGDNPPMDALSELGVTTVCCYITSNPIDDPKHLYSTKCETWDKAAMLLFRMSSIITTQEIPHTIFLKREWTIDTTNNETRLFAQVNHPDIIEDVCDLARDVVCCQDALSKVLSKVSLDLYINKANQGFEPQKQDGKTCYANASATVMHLSMHRIVGREGGYPDFFDLREKIINKYGKNRANTLTVLKEVCPEYRLHCKEVNGSEAMKAIIEKRPVVARFSLTEAEWNIFFKFFKSHNSGILTNSTIDIKKRSSNDELFGHAVVLTSFNSESLRLMNSRGSNWADGGFFRIARADVLGLQFFDVFWTKNDLQDSEKDAYKASGPQEAQAIISKLKYMQAAEYVCPLCHRSSHVLDFTGHHLEAKCPECEGKFNIKDEGGDLALTLYLLSLSANAK